MEGGERSAMQGGQKGEKWRGEDRNGDASVEHSSAKLEIAGAGTAVLSSSSSVHLVTRPNIVFFSKENTPNQVFWKPRLLILDKK